MKFSAALFLGASLLVASPAMAQNAPAASQAAKPVAGAVIYDPQGGEIGTIESVTAEAVVVNTGTNQVALPPAAVGSNEKGLVASTTKADLDAAAAKAHADAQAHLQALLSPGTAVNSSDGQPVGTVKAADPQYVTVTTSQGVDVKLPANAFSVGQTGGLTIAMTAANFNAAVAGSGATAAPSAADATAPAAGDAAAATDAAGAAAEGAAQ
ncbi:MAG TPA: hypothetical protein VM657_02380 [Sphingomonas sp.]|nr:hypothetical protein [Sphingomonas sp.]